MIKAVESETPTVKPKAGLAMPKAMELEMLTAMESETQMGNGVGDAKGMIVESET